MSRHQVDELIGDGQVDLDFRVPAQNPEMKSMNSAHCPMLGFDYVDFLSLLYQDGKWAIVAKTFTEQSRT